MKILGIRIDNLSREEILAKIRNFLAEEKFHQIATINPEFILAAQKDAGFKNILNGCDLNVADGAGIGFAFWRRGARLKARFPGTDLMDGILKMAQEKNFKIFLAANKDGLSAWEVTRDAILKKYPNLEIAGADINCHSGLDPESNSVNTYSNFNTGSFDFAQDDKYNAKEFDAVFANFGAPYQEKFLNSLKNAENSKIRLAMGVGGSFDYLTGKVRRAPVFMRKLGLEWLWRFILQPRRLKRIINAIIIFPFKIIFKNEVS